MRYRHRFTNAVTLQDQLGRICQRLQVISDDSHNRIAKVGNALARDAHLFTRRLAHVVDATGELIEYCEVLSATGEDSSLESIRELQEHVERSRALLLSMRCLTASLCQGWTFLTASTYSSLLSLTSRC
jgi:hypothetical protein